MEVVGGAAFFRSLGLERLWRDVQVPAELKEQAAREIFDKIELRGREVVAVYPRAEHAWLLGMAATKADRIGNGRGERI